MMLPQSPTRVNIIYRNVYCLNVDLLQNGLVALRDGAYSSFDTSKLIEEFIQIQGLKVICCVFEEILCQSLHILHIPFQ